MSGSTTVSGSTILSNFTSAGSDLLATYFNTSDSYAAVSSSGSVSVSGAVVITGSGSDYTISGASAIDDASGSGENSVTLTTSSIVWAGEGDTVSAASSAATIFGSNYGTTTFTLGGDNNSVTGGSGSLLGTVSGSNSTLVGGSGTSVLSVTGSNNLVVGGSSGSTTVDLSSTTGAETITTNPNGSDGSLFATMGSGADTFVGGTGNATVVSGSGSDVFAFVDKNSGESYSTTIYNFTSSDNLAFSGYDNSKLTETVTNGSDVITLSDGSTITLVGVDHKLFS